MKAFIEHESRGRLRVRMKQYRMTLEQADLLEAYLQNQPGVLNAAVHERTCCAVIRYIGDRENIIRAIAQFNYTAPSVTALTRPTAAVRSTVSIRKSWSARLLRSLPARCSCHAAADCTHDLAVAAVPRPRSQAPDSQRAEG